MIDADLRLSRVLLRARHLGWDGDAVDSLARVLRGDAPTVELLARAASMAPRPLGAMLALAFGGSEDAPDAIESAALSLARANVDALSSLLDHVDAAAPCWPGVVSLLLRWGHSLDALLAALVRRAAVWVSLDGSLASVGVALRTLLSADPLARVPRLMGCAEDGATLLAARVLRAFAAAPPEAAAALEVFRALPPGLRGAGADALLAHFGPHGMQDVLDVARGERGATATDASSAAEALLRHRPEATAGLVHALLAPASGASNSLRSEALRAHAPADPGRFAALAAEHARRDPGEWVAVVAASWPEAPARPLWEALLGVPTAALATRAAEALLGSSHPGRGALAAALLREPGAASREVVIASCAGLPEQELGPVLALLGEGSSEVRIAAVRALAGRGDVVAAALAERHSVERAPRVRAAIVEALGYAPSAGASTGGDAARAALVARAEAGRVGPRRRPSRWMERCDAQLRWHDGGAVPGSVAAHLVRLQSLRGAIEPDPEVVGVAKMLHPADREGWAESLLDAWVAADAPPQDHGVLLIAALLGGALASRSLGEAIPQWHRGSRRSLAASAVQLLALRGADHSLCELDALARAHPHESIGASARRALDEEAGARGVDVEVMLDLEALRFGLDGASRRFELGHHAVVLAIEGAELVLRDESGARLHGPPRASKRDDPERVEELRRAVRVMHLLLEPTQDRQRARFLDAMASRRVFGAEHLARCLDHPILGPLGRRLQWAREGRVSSGEALAAGALAGAWVIAHPAEHGAGVDARDAPFAQLERPSARPPTSARAATRWSGLAGRTLVARGERHSRSHPPWTAHGWIPGTVEQGRCHSFSLRFNGARIEAVLSVEGIALWSEGDRQTLLGELRFLRWDGGAEIALGELPVGVFSEAVTRAEAMLRHPG